MKRSKLPLLGVLTAMLVLNFASAQEPLVDFDKARQLFERRQRGETLTADEDAYIKRAMAEHQKLRGSNVPAPAISAGTGAGASAAGIDMERARALYERRQKGETLSKDDEAYLQRAIAARRGGGGPAAPAGSSTPVWSGHLVPLTELGATKYKGEDGGLYGDGRNEPPKDHLNAALKEAAKIRPLDPSGVPSTEGRIGLISVGMSNTTMEFSRFRQLADADPARSRRVVLIDGAQGGQTGLRWADPNSQLWRTVDERLRTAGVTARQVQVAWMKQAEAGPANHGEFPKHAKQLQESLVKSLANLKEKFPNLRIVYLSSRIYAGYATTQLNPEPYAYEEAFTMRWLIQDQIGGRAVLNFDPARGPVKSPLLIWGPYLWADGKTPRNPMGFFTLGKICRIGMEPIPRSRGN